jgi:hypothetical protein
MRIRLIKADEVVLGPCAKDLPSQAIYGCDNEAVLALEYSYQLTALLNIKSVHLPRTLKQDTHPMIMAEESHLVDYVALTLEVECNLTCSVVDQPDFLLMPNLDHLIIHFEASLDRLIGDLEGFSDVKVLILIFFTVCLYYLGQKLRRWLNWGHFSLFWPFLLGEAES